MSKHRSQNNQPFVCAMEREHLCIVQVHRHSNVICIVGPNSDEGDDNNKHINYTTCSINYRLIIFCSSRRWARWLRLRSRQWLWSWLCSCIPCYDLQISINQKQACQLQITGALIMTFVMVRYHINCRIIISSLANTSTTISRDATAAAVPTLKNTPPIKCLCRHLHFMSICRTDHDYSIT